MSNNFDDLIGSNLEEDERELLARLGDEPGFFEQARANFAGPLAWVVWLVYILNIICFLIFAFAAWRVFAETDIVDIARWGFVALAMLMFTLFFKGSLAAHGQTNRVLRALQVLQTLLLKHDGR